MSRNPYYDEDGAAADDSSWGGDAESQPTSPPPAPAPPADQASVLPEWARIAAEVPEDPPEQEPAPARPAPAVPAPVPAPAVPAPAVPTAPVPAPAVPASPVPTAPVPAPAVPASPVPAPAPALSTLTPSEEPAAYEAHAVNPIPPAPDIGRGPSSAGRSTFVPPDQQAPPHPADEQRMPPLPHTEEPSAGKRGLFGGGRRRTAGTSKKEAKSPRRPGSSGGRWRLVVFRGGVWAAIAIVALAGLRAAFFPPTPDVSAIAGAVGQAYGLTSFPSAAGEAIAVQFAKDYLTVNPSVAEKRSMKLKSYLSTDPGDITWVDDLAKNQLSRQLVCAGPYMVQPPSVYRDDAGWRVTYLIAAQVAMQTDPQVNPCAGGVGGTTMYLNVPVFAALPTGQGEVPAVVVSGQPGVMPAPPRGSDPGLYDFDCDAKTADEMGANLGSFFTAWGQSSEELVNYLAPEAQADPTAAASVGMNKAVRLVSVNKICPEIAANPQTPRFVEVSVTWSSAGDNQWTQSYALSAVKPAGSTVWQVISLNGGIFDRP